MKPRGTLLVVINKKVEWGVLGVADIAVKRVISGYTGRAARGDGVGRLRALAKALDYLPLALDQARLYGRPGCQRRLRRLSAPVGLIRSFWISSLPLLVRSPRADGVLTG